MFLLLLPGKRRQAPSSRLMTVNPTSSRKALCENGWIRGSSPRMTLNEQPSACRSGSVSHAASSHAGGKNRSGRHGGGSEQPASPEDHRDRHEDVRAGGGYGGDPEDPAADGGSHHRPDRQHGLAAGLDRRHHRRRSRRRAMPRRDRPCAAGREMARRSSLCRHLARKCRGRAQAPGGARCRSPWPVRSVGGEPARQRPARSARYLPGLCDAGPDDHPDQRPAMDRLQEVRMGRGRRDRVRGFMGRALKTGEPSLSLPCYAERRYGGVPDEEMLMALSPKHLAKAITGMKALSKNGLRYPIAPYGIQSDVRAGMGVSYARK